ncbi:MAG: hypothetical protein AB1403_22115, partial [Candidatus Riflebacteria bacterium]
MIKDYRRYLSGLLIAGLASASALVAAPAASEISRIKLVNNNHVPQKILVCSAYNTQRFVKDLFN